jgi:hypothetical protein
MSLRARSQGLLVGGTGGKPLHTQADSVGARRGEVEIASVGSVGGVGTQAFVCPLPIYAANEKASKHARHTVKSLQSMLRPLLRGALFCMVSGGEDRARTEDAYAANTFLKLSGSLDQLMWVDMRRRRADDDLLRPPGADEAHVTSGSGALRVDSLRFAVGAGRLGLQLPVVGSSFVFRLVARTAKERDVWVGGLNTLLLLSVGLRKS